jgi:hypothetical protein
MGYLVVIRSNLPISIHTNRIIRNLSKLSQHLELQNGNERSSLRPFIIGNPPSAVDIRGTPISRHLQVISKNSESCMCEERERRRKETAALSSL